MESMKTKNENEDALKVYLERLNQGEKLEDVRADFANEFENVSVTDIMAAEQSLIKDGADPRKMKSLCDLHSALFHGRTEAEAMSEETRLTKFSLKDFEEGHPVRYFVYENSALEQLLIKISRELTMGHVEELQQDLNRLRNVRTLYGKKEELIMPALERHGVTGPTEVMWPVDDDIKRDVARLAGELSLSGIDAVSEDIKAVIKRMREMIYKDENILLPVSLRFFNEDEWLNIYWDEFEMGPAFIDKIPTWQRGEDLRRRKQNAGDTSSMGVLIFDGDAIHSPAGTLTMDQLKGLLTVLPIDITFIDDGPVNRFYKNTDKVFSRPLSSLGQSTYQCHPVLIRPVVKKLLADFKSGEKDSFERFVKIKGRPVRVLYLAVRSEEGKYLGAVEVIQDLTDIQAGLAKLK